MKFQIHPFPSLLIVLISCLLFIPNLGLVHLFDWDEINFAESAREMIVSGNYSQVQINFNPFWEKPPLFIWMQVVSMKIFGVNEFAARFPNALFGVLTLVYIFNFAKSVFKGHIANWWVLAYLGAITPHFYFKTGLIDPVFNFFIFLSVIQIYEAFKKHSLNLNSNINFLKAGIYTGVAILCKGPVALLIVLLVIFSIVISKRMVWFFSFGNVLLYSFTILIVTSVWFLPETISNGPYFLIEFVRYQIGLFSQNIAGHQQPFYYHFLIILIGCFPISLIALFGYKKNRNYIYNENLFRMFMMCLFWVVLILFSIVKTKIVHYSSLCWLPLSFLAAYSIENFCNKNQKFRFVYLFVIVLFGLLISSAVIALPYIMNNRLGQLIKNINDDFAVHNLLANVSWGYLETLPGVVLLFGLIGAVMFYFARRNKLKYTFGFILISVALFVNLSSFMLVPKVEAHTQKNIVEFYKILKYQDCYIQNVGYKTYAHYFYAEVKPLKMMDRLNLIRQKFYRENNVKYYLELDENARMLLDNLEKDWLLNGLIDKTVYFIAKINNQQDLDKNPLLELVYSKDGFVAYKRTIKNIK